MLLVLHVEDSVEDHQLIAGELARSFPAVACRRVETEAAYLEALRTERWDVVLADHRLPSFSALAALRLLRAIPLDLPFIIVSGTLGEELAVEALRAGAHDFVTKERLARLAPAIERELREAAGRQERRVAEGRLREAEARLAASDRMVAVGTLAASVAHEVNSPLAAALANLALAQEALPGLPASEAKAALVETLDDARAAVQRVRDIVKDLRILAREGDPEGTADLPAVVDAASRLAWNEIRHRARLVKELGGTPPVRCSEGRLGQVVLNLLVNAAQAIPEGNAEAHRITVRSAVAPDGRVCLEVEDSGCGMSQATLERLFTPFFTTKPPGLGTGLGLTISRRIVEEQGGAIEVESQPARGTRFRVLLPAAGAPPTAAERPPASPPPAGPPRRARVLIVDDDELVSRSVHRMLRHLHDVVQAQAAEALARVAAGERFDVVLCDLMMPTMTGMELQRRIRELDAEQARRMVFITGGAFTPAAQAFLEAGVPHLLKPLDPDTLRRVVAEVAG